MKKRTPGPTAMTREQVQHVQRLRRSGAAGGHDTRQRGMRTRGGAERAAIRDSRGH